jgi:hypothetical protein
MGLELLHGQLMEQSGWYNDDTRIQRSVQYSVIT